jgi:hypothetical protein
VTNDPSVVASADVVIFGVPAFAHEGYLNAIKPHLGHKSSKTPDGRVILGAMPAESGFDLQVSRIIFNVFFIKPR